MERAARDMVGSALLESHEVTHYIHDLSRVENPVYRLLRNHFLLLVNLFVFHILCCRLFRILCCSWLFTRELYFIFVNRLLHLP